MRLFVLAVAMLMASFVSEATAAHEYTVGTLFVHHPAVNATGPSAATAAGYFSIKNNGDDDDRLVSIKVPDLADKAEIHTKDMDNGVMRMRTLSALTIPVGKEIALTPEGTHIMFSGLKHPLTAGEKYEGVIHFERAGDVKVFFAVEPAGSVPSTENDESHGHSQMEHTSDHMNMNMGPDIPVSGGNPSAE